MNKDAINPDHYKWLPNGIEAIDICENLGYNLGNVVKYILRAGRKDPSKLLEDLKKAQWYLNRQIENLTEEELGNTNQQEEEIRKVLYSSQNGELLQISLNHFLYAKISTVNLENRFIREAIADLVIEAYGCKYHDIIGYFENPVSPDEGQDVKLFRVWITKELEKKIWG